LAEVIREFDGVSHGLRDEAKHGKREPFEIKIGNRLPDLMEKLQAQQSQSIVIVTAAAMFVPPATTAAKGYIAGVVYNMGIVDAQTREMLWWNSVSDREVNGHNATFTENSVRALLKDLPAPGK